MLVNSSRILGIVVVVVVVVVVACSSLKLSFSISRPSDAEFGLACSSRCAVCSIAVVVIQPRLCDFVMLGIKFIYFRILVRAWTHFVVLYVGAETHFVSSRRARPGSIARYCGVCIVVYSRALKQPVSALSCNSPLYLFHRHI